jgi:hypothetical protein
LAHAIRHGDEAFDKENRNVILVFGLLNWAKWTHFVLALIPFRAFGRPIMPVVQGFMGLIPLLRLFVMVLGGFVCFWTILNVGELGFWDYVPGAFYFGMTADFDSVSDFRDPQQDQALMQVVLILLTLTIPVILMNCTIASMATDYERVFDEVEQFYQRHLSNTVFRYAAVMLMMNQVFGLRTRFTKSPSYLWYACESSRAND